MKNHSPSSSRLATILLWLATATLLHAQAGGPVFRQQPIGQSVCSGGDCVLHVEADPPGGAFQWVHDTIPIPGATTNTLTITNFDPAIDAGLYYCVATSPGGSTPSDPALVSAAEGTFGSFQLHRSGGPNPWCPLCPHPPIIDPLDRIIPGTTTTIDLRSANAARLSFSNGSVQEISQLGAVEDLRLTCRGLVGDIEHGLVALQLKRDGVGLPWWMYGWFDPFLNLRSASVRFQIVSGTNVLADIVGAPTEGVSCPAFPDHVGSVTESRSKFGAVGVPTTELVNIECLVAQWRSPKFVTFRGVVYPATEVRFMVEPSVTVTTKTTLSLERRQAAQDMTTAPALVLSDIAVQGNDLPSAPGKNQDALSLVRGVTGVFDPATGHYALQTPPPNENDPEWDRGCPPRCGLPLARSVRKSGTTEQEIFYLLADDPVWPGGSPPAGVPSGAILFTEVTTQPAFATEAHCIFNVPQLDMGPNGKPPVITLRANATFSDGVSTDLTHAPLCEVQQVLLAPGTPLPIRAHISFALADYTLEIYHQGVLQAAYPCAGGPVINLPDWLKDLKLEARSAPSPVGTPIIKGMLTARFGEPLPQPWACQLEVNGVTVQGDELVFVRENLPSPAPAAPTLVALEPCSFGSGGGAGKVNIQDLSFTAHRTVAMGDMFASGKNLRLANGDFEQHAIAIVPAENGKGISERGIKRTADRPIPIPLPPDYTDPTAPPPPGPVNAIVPTVSNHAVRTKGSGANVGKIVAPATPDGTGGLSAALTLSFAECDAWELALAPDPPLEDWLPTGSSLLLTARGTVESTTGVPPVPGIVVGAVVGSLLAEVGAPVIGNPTSPDYQPVTLTPDFSALARPDHRIKIKSHGVVLLDLDHRTGPACVLSHLPERWGKLGTSTECFFTRDDRRFFVTIPGLALPPIDADEVEIILASGGPPGGPQVLAKTHIELESTLMGLGLLGCQRKAKTSEAEMNLSSIHTSAVNGLGGALVCPIWDDGSGKGCTEDAVHSNPLYDDNDTSGTNPLYENSSRALIRPHILEHSPRFLAEGPAGSSFIIDGAGALSTQFTLVRTDRSGPDCGAIATLTTTFKQTQGTTPAEIPVSTHLDRTPDNRCVISPDFSAFGGEIEVFSWSFGASQSGSFSAGATSGGRFLTTGLSLTTPVWPVSFGGACVANSVLSGDIIWMDFPTPTEVFLGGTLQTVGRLAFVSRPLLSFGPLLIHDSILEIDETFSLSISDLRFVMPPPPYTFGLLPDGSFAFDVHSPHSTIFRSSDLVTWSIVDDYDVRLNPDGSMCHHGHHPIPYAQSAFYRARGGRKGWDGTIKGSGTQ